MDRIVGIETEYGCLLSEEEPHVNSELWPAKVKNYLFRKAKAGTIDLHYRDYEEPPGNGGFLLNGGRLYLDMGHIEYASPECLHLHDLVTYELAGDDLLQSSPQVNFQLSQRADHIVNDIYQWVQFNRAIINARDEPLADYRKYRRLHLLIGDSNMSPYANALKIGTTACVLSLLEEGRLPRNLVLADAVQSTRNISRDPTQRWIVDLENGKTIRALDVQWEFHQLAQKYLRNSSAETNWLLENWGFVLEAIPHNRHALIGGVDWITKKWLLEAFVESEGLSWDDPWLQSVDLEYHNIDPRRGLFFAVTPGKRIAEWNNSVRRPSAMRVPPANTRASGRARAVAFFQSSASGIPYVINWDSIACDSRDFLVMGNPFETYNDEVERFLAKPRVTNTDTECADR